MDKIVRIVCTTLLALSSTLHSFVPADYHVPFDEGMSPRETQWGKYCNEDHGWYDAIRALYEKNNLSQVTPSEQTRIPKIIHQVWLGSTVPERYNSWRASWTKHNPDWEYKLWTDKEVAELELVNRELYDATTNFGAKSDILRYELLNQFGGLYVDTDFECYKPFDMLNHSYDFYTGVCNAGGFNLACGLIGSVPGHPIVQECIQAITELNTPPYTHHEILMNVSVICFTRGFMKGIEQDEDRVVALPHSYFYPRSHMSPGEVYADCYGKHTFAVHHWEGAWANVSVPLPEGAIAPFNVTSARRRRERREEEAKQNKFVAHKQTRFAIVIPSYNNIEYYERNLDSVLEQDYENYRVFYLDDASNDGTSQAVQEYLAEHDTHKRVSYIRNDTNHCALANLYAAAHFCDDAEVVVVVDGDDWLHDDGVLTHLDEVYVDDNVWLTFGSYIDYPGGKTGIFAKPYKASVVKKGQFRKASWGASHLRTYYASLFKKIKQEDLVDSNGSFFRASADQATMFPMLEMARERHKYISRVMYVYNRESPLNEHKVAKPRQEAIAKEIKRRPSCERLDSLFSGAGIMNDILPRRKSKKKS